MLLLCLGEAVNGRLTHALHIRVYSAVNGTGQRTWPSKQKTTTSDLPHIISAAWNVHFARH